MRTMTPDQTVKMCRLAAMMLLCMTHASYVTCDHLLPQVKRHVTGIRGNLCSLLDSPPPTCCRQNDIT